ncbi:MAG: hypothetical protein KGV56_03300 [Gammaproteobacteria bacterium]|nr:hypothetical protein [Gammaproteobacteria bacterium]
MKQITTQEQISAQGKILTAYSIGWQEVSDAAFLTRIAIELEEQGRRRESLDMMRIIEDKLESSDLQNRVWEEEKKFKQMEKGND